MSLNLIDEKKSVRPLSLSGTVQYILYIFGTVRVTLIRLAFPVNSSLNWWAWCMTVSSD